MFAALISDVKVIKLESVGDSLFDIGQSSDFFYFILNGGLEI
jgi:hypothetical protein